MRTHWVKFFGISGAILVVIGIATLLSFGTGFVLSVSFANMIVGGVLLLTWFLLEGARHIFTPGGLAGNRLVRFSTSVLVYGVLFVAFLGSVNYLGSKHNYRFDLTENGVYSLAPQSIELVENLEGQIKIIAFENGATQSGPTYDLLNLYQSAGKTNIDVKIVNSASKPHLVDRYGMREGNLVYLEYSNGKQRGVSRLNRVDEQEITNAIIKLTRGAAKKVYFLTGHGEPGIDDGGELGLKVLAESMVDEHMSVAPLLLANLEEVPKDAAAVFVVAPKQTVLGAELDVLQRYVEGGGHLLLLTEPRQSPELVEFGQRFGISINNDIVVDTVQRLLQGPTLGVEPIANSYGFHPITRSLTQEKQISVFRLASSVTVAGDKKDKKATYTELVKTGENSWAEKNLSAILDDEVPTVALEPEDVKGPISLAVSYEKVVKNEKEAMKGRLVVFGDSDWVRNSAIGTLANKDLVLNAANWLSGQESGLTIRPRRLRDSAAEMTLLEVQAILSWSFFILESVLLLGLVVWWARKQTRLGTSPA